MLSEKEVQIIDLFTNTNKTQMKMAEEMQTTPYQISKVLSKYKIPRVRKHGLRFRKHNLNDHYFEAITNHEKAYILGLLSADGYLVVESTKTKRVGIDLIDREILVDVGKAIGHEGNVVNIGRGRSGFASDNDMYRLKISSPIMYNDLIKLGCVEHKSKCLLFPTEGQVPREFMSSYLLGYFDGDGSIYSQKIKGVTPRAYSVSITGTEEFTDGLLYFLGMEHLKKDKRWKDRDNNNTSITIAGNLQVHGLMSWLYSESPLRIERKHDIFKELDKQHSRVKQ